VNAALTIGAARIAQLCGVSRQAVYGWLARGHLPVDAALRVEAACGVNAEQLVEPTVAQLLRDRRPADNAQSGD
jgi:hypothetical protein